MVKVSQNYIQLSLRWSGNTQTEGQKDKQTYRQTKIGTNGKSLTQ